MKEITNSNVEKSIYLALHKTYVKALKEATPGDGQTKNNWDVKIDGDKIVIFNSPTGDIIEYQNDGTKATIIRAKNKKFLKFKKPKTRKSSYQKIDGNVAFEKDGFIFTKAVRHPGIEAKRFIERIMEDKILEKQFRLELEKQFEKYMK